MHNAHSIKTVKFVSINWTCAVFVMVHQHTLVFELDSAFMEYVIYGIVDKLNCIQWFSYLNCMSVDHIVHQIILLYKWHRNYVSVNIGAVCSLYVQ